MDITISKKEMIKAMEVLPDPMPIKRLLGTIEILRILKVGQQQIAQGQFLTHEELIRHLGLSQGK